MNQQMENNVKLTVAQAPSTDLVLESLLAEIQGFATLLKHYEIEVGIESEPARAAWFNLAENAKQEILKRFSTYHRNCRDLHMSGISLRDNIAVLSHCLKRSNLFAKNDIREFISNEHMVEVYNLENVQIFRSINFFDYCNYTLLDLLSREWMELYERLSSITESIFREIHSSVAAKEFRLFDTPAHVMKEKYAKPCGVFRTDLLSCCPVYSAPELVSGYLLALDVTELDVQDTSNSNLSFLR